MPEAQDAAPVGNLYADLEVDVPVTCEEASDEDVNPKFEVIGEDFQVEDQVKGDELEFDVDMEGENESEKEENPAESGEEETLSVEVLSTPDDTPVTQEEAEEEFEMEPFDPRLDLSSYQAPPLTLLEDYKDKWYVVTREELEKNNRQIVKTLANYKIGITKISARVGPTVCFKSFVSLHSITTIPQVVCQQHRL